MRIRIAFTLDVPRESLPALRELADPDAIHSGHDEITAIRDFLGDDAEQYIIGCMTDNGVGGVKLVRSARWGHIAFDTSSPLM
jgi:hypothetical protein